MMDAWVDKELSPEKKINFEHHLVSCKSCSAQAQDLRCLTEILNTHPPANPSAGLKEKTLSLFIKETDADFLWSWPGWGMPAAVTASGLAGLGIGYQLGAGWTGTQLPLKYSISGFLFSAGDLLLSWA